MAQKRMLDKKISVSEQVANLSPVAQLIFTWSICHADDVGVLPSGHRTLRGTLVPLLDIEMPAFSACVEEILAQGLWEMFTYSGKDFYRLPEFFSTQTLKKDRQPHTILPVVILPTAAESWKFLESIGSVLEPEVKGSEVKRREENKESADASPKWFEKINSKDQEYKELIRSLASKDYLSGERLHAIIQEEMVPFFREKSDGGKKERWEKEKVFDYKRRVSTWIKNFHTYKKDVKCSTAGVWHGKGETCHHKKPEIDYKSLPTSGFAKELGMAKRV